jgi:uncharacterized protein (DUF1015 family)
MAEVRPFRGLRYSAAADPSLAIAPPYDVISPGEQRALYARSPYNVVRVEYGEQRAGDGDSDNRYTRAAADIARLRAEGVLALDDVPAIYGYRQQFSYGGRDYLRQTWFVALRLEEWDKGAVKPHEHTLAHPKADRLELLRAARTQISPVYSLFRAKNGESDGVPSDGGTPLLDFEVDGQRHTLTAIRDAGAIGRFEVMLANSDVYIADGHHRYETALAYRDEVHARARAWTGDEPENFVLMGLSAFDDPGLLVLPTHRLVYKRPSAEAIDQLQRHFAFRPFAADAFEEAIKALSAARETSFMAIGLTSDTVHLVTLRDRAAVEAMMPHEQSDAWKQLDVNVLQYGVLLDVFGIDDAALNEGGAVTYTQDAAEARRRVETGEAACAFLLNATPVEQVLAVADAGGRMPQKSTYFYPKLPTGLVMRSLG